MYDFIAQLIRQFLWWFGWSTTGLLTLAFLLGSIVYGKVLWQYAQVLGVSFLLSLFLVLMIVVTGVALVTWFL